jgi:hypothetical protein
MGRAASQAKSTGVDGFTAVFGGKRGSASTLESEAIEAERAAEIKAARVHGPLWMRLDDGDESAFALGVEEFRLALDQVELGTILSDTQARNSLALARMAVRKQLQSMRPHLQDVGTAFGLDSSMWKDQHFLKPGPADLAVDVRERLRDDYAEGINLSSESVHAHARMSLASAASSLIYWRGVHPHPLAAATTLGLGHELAIPSSKLRQAQWEKALCGWLNGSVGQMDRKSLKNLELRLRLQLKSTTSRMPEHTKRG